MTKGLIKGARRPQPRGKLLDVVEDGAGLTQRPQLRGTHRLELAVGHRQDHSIIGPGHQVFDQVMPYSA